MCMRMLAEGLNTEFIGSIPIILEMEKHFKGSLNPTQLLHHSSLKKKYLTPYCFIKSQKYLRPKITFVDILISSECENSLLPLTGNETELKNNPHIKLNIHCVFLLTSLSNYNCLLFLTI